MQEEVENRAVNLVISTTKLSGRVIVSAARKGLAALRNKTRATKERKPVGKQTIKQLIGQNQGVSNIDVAKTDLKRFEKYARKYSVDYAVMEDKSGEVPKYLVFFKARDADAMTAAFNSYSAEVLRKPERSSVRKLLRSLTEKVRNTPEKVKVHEKEREQTR